MNLSLLIANSLVKGSIGSFSGSVYSMVNNTGPVGKLILIFLFGLSVYAWTIIIKKYIAFRDANKEDSKFIKLYNNRDSLANIHISSKNYKNSPIAKLFSTGYEELSFLLNSQENQDKINDIEPIKKSLDRALRKEISQFENYLPFLGTTGNIAPFVGLFGTVWGVMMSLHEIGEKSSASISVVAPGLSEALITTAAGIIVSVPAVMFFNHFVSKLRNLTDDMEDFRLDFLTTVEKMY